MKAYAQRFLAYLTGAFALFLVGSAAASALTYAVMHRSETLQNLASSTLTGVGMAVGGCIGSALVLRFKAARRFVKMLVHEINERHDTGYAAGCAVGHGPKHETK